MHFRHEPSDASCVIYLIRFRYADSIELACEKEISRYLVPIFYFLLSQKQFFCIFRIFSRLFLVLHVAVLISFLFLKNFSYVL